MPHATSHVAGAESSTAPVLPRLHDPSNTHPITLEMALSAWDEYQQTGGLTAQYRREGRVSVTRCADLNGWTSPVDFSAEGVRRWLMDCEAKGNAPRYRNHQRDCVRLFCEFCRKEWGLLEQNPVLGSRRARVPKDSPRGVPEVQQVVDLIRHVGKSPNLGDRWVTYLLAATTGLRFAAIKRLEWSWVHLEDGRKAWINCPENLCKKSPKTKLWITRELADVLRSKARTSKFIVTNVPRASSFDDDLRRCGIAKRGDDGKALSRHSLRHFSITYMRSAETFTDQERAQQAQHTTAAMTVGVYTHNDFAPLGEKIYRLQPLLGGTLPNPPTKKSPKTCNTGGENPIDSDTTRLADKITTENGRVPSEACGNVSRGTAFFSPAPENPEDALTSGPGRTSAETGDDPQTARKWAHTDSNLLRPSSGDDDMMAVAIDLAALVQRVLAMKRGGNGERL